MTGGVTHVIQVVMLAACAYTFLAGNRAYIVAPVQTQEAVLKLVHPRIGKQQGWVIGRNQGAGGNTGVSLRFKVTQESFTNFVRCHNTCHSKQLQDQSQAIGISGNSIGKHKPAGV